MRALVSHAQSPIAAGVAPEPARRLRTVLVGSGSLGRAFLRAVQEQNAPIELVGMLTGRHGRLTSASGIDLDAALFKVEAKEELGGPSGGDDFARVLEELRPSLLVECIPQNVRSGEPSLSFLRTALDRGVNVVTANKAAIALGYRDLLHRASRTGARFRFEATVLDALPAFAMMSRLRDVEISRVRGVLNGTSSLVLESVQLGSTRSRGLARAQAQGIAEADCVLDLDGWDAAAKAALLANVWMGGALRVVDVVRTGCETLKDEQLRETGDNLHYRLVADVTKDESGNVRAKVEPVGLEPGDPFFSLKGGNGGLQIECRGGPRFTMLQDSHGLDDAAFALLQDCRAILAGDAQV